MILLVALEQALAAAAVVVVAAAAAAAALIPKVISMQCEGTAVKLAGEIAVCFPTDRLETPTAKKEAEPKCRPH